MTRLTILVLTLLLSVTLTAQSQRDSLPVLTLEAIQEWIKQNHPLTQVAQLNRESATAGLLSARGAFDPKLFADWEQKHFDKKDYYAVGEGGLKLPTRFLGAEFKATYNTARGLFLNPMLNLPQRGQLNLGIKLPLLQGMRIDRNRSELQIAQLDIPRNEAMFRADVATLILDATSLYWQWWSAYYQLKQVDYAITLTSDRLENIIDSYEAGDRPAIDTLETFIQLQNRQQQRNDALIDFQNASWNLANFFGDAERLSTILANQYRPSDDLDSGSLPNPGLLDDLLDQAAQRNPELIELDFKRQQQEVEQRLAKEQLLPKLDVEYNLLGDGFDLNNRPKSDNGEAGLDQLLTQNFKWGLQFEMPLFFRKQRGKLEQKAIKVSQTELKRKQKALNISNKVQNYYLELQNMQSQVELLERTVENYATLLEMEQVKFEIGESSVFLLNSRELKLIDSRIKLVSVKAKYLKTFWKLQEALGALI